MTRTQIFDLLQNTASLATQTLNAGYDSAYAYDGLRSDGSFAEHVDDADILVIADVDYGQITFTIEVDDEIVTTDQMVEAADIIAFVLATFEASF